MLELQPKTVNHFVPLQDFIVNKYMKKVVQKNGQLITPALIVEHEEKEREKYKEKEVFSG